MPEGGYWTRRRLSRRGMLRGAGVGIAGLAGAALIGCGGSDDEGGDGGGSSGGGTGGASTGAATGGGGEAGSGIPTNVTRAAGFDPSLGVVPINEKNVVPGGTFRRRRADTTRQQDPDISIAGSDHEFVNDRLLIANGWTMELQPDLLESYEITDPDGLEMVLKLRPGIKTHDIAPVNGRDFTAEDVAYSINRKAGILDPAAAEKYARADQFVGLERAEAVDDLTVRLVMSSPNSAILAAFADPRAQMIPKEQDDIGYTDPLKFVGTGAWMQTEFVEGTRQVFTPHPNYYRQWDDGGRPGIDAVEYLVIGDRASELASFLTGELSVISAIQSHEEPQIRSSVGDAQWFAQPNLGWYHFAVNQKLPFFAEDRVRQAFQLSMDFNALGDSVGDGWLYSGPLHVMFPEALKSDELATLPGYNPATKEQDIAEAVRLLDAAGYPEGDGIKFKNQPFQASGITFDLAVRQKDHWAGIFPKMDMEITPVTDYASFTNLLNTREFEARTYHHTMVPNATIDARTYYHSQGGRNYQSFEKDWAEEVLDKILTVQDVQERTELLRPFQLRYIKEGPPLLQLFVSRDAIAYHSNWGGMDLASGTWAYGLASYGVGYRWLWQTE